MRVEEETAKKRLTFDNTTHREITHANSNSKCKFTKAFRKSIL